MKNQSISNYRRQKGRHFGRAFVSLNGGRHYLGEYAKPESREEYRRLPAQWSVNSQQEPVDYQWLS